MILTFVSILGCDQDLEIDGFESRTPDSSKDLSVSSSCTGRVQTKGGRLNIRYTDNISDNICASLENGTPVTISLDQIENDFLKIKSTECSEAKSEFNIEWVYASKNFIALNSDCFEIAEPGTKADKPKPKREPGNTVSSLILDVSNYISNNLENVRITRPLLRSGANGLVDLYKLPGIAEKSICGSKHIRSQRSAAYMEKGTMCAWTSVAQEWAKLNCPEGDSSCRLLLGDATFGRVQPSSWPHSTHRRGWCMDIWPLRKKGCFEKEVRWQDDCYDRRKTQKLVKLLIKNGADVGNQLFFNDPEISETRRLSNHDDHIHVCFKPTNSTVQSSCKNLELDRNYCPEFN